MSDVVKALREALDYTRLYRDQVFVIKLGGEVLASSKGLDDLAVQVALLESLSIRVVLVHGGGPQVSELSRKFDITPEIVAGRRVTTPEVLDIVLMVLAGTLNTQVVSALVAHGVKAVGMTGLDGGAIKAQRRAPVVITDDDGHDRLVDFGDVGDIKTIDTSLIDHLLPAGFVPVIASIAGDEGARPLNVNADFMAESIACALKAKKLIFLTGAPGLLRDVKDSSSLVAFAGPEDLEELITGGAIRGGMRPKVEACLRAVQDGVKRTHIVDGRVQDALLVEVFTGRGSGTMIVGKRENEIYTQDGR